MVAACTSGVTASNRKLNVSALSYVEKQHELFLGNPSDEHRWLHQHSTANKSDSTCRKNATSYVEKWEINLNHHFYCNSWSDETAAGISPSLLAMPLFLWRLSPLLSHPDHCRGRCTSPASCDGFKFRP